MSGFHRCIGADDGEHAARHPTVAIRDGHLIGISCGLASRIGHFDDVFFNLTKRYAGEIADEFAASLNSLRHATWKDIHKQMPPKGLVLASSIDTNIASVLAEFLPVFQRLLPGALLTQSDIRLLVDCSARICEGKVSVTFAAASRGREDLDRLAKLLYAAGAEAVGGPLTDGHNLREHKW